MNRTKIETSISLQKMKWVNGEIVFSSDNYNAQEKDIKCWDLFYVNLPKSKCHIQSGVRPCLIASNDKNNEYSPNVHIIPITSQIEKAKLPTHVLLGDICGLTAETSTLLAEQEMLIPKEQLDEKIGHIDNENVKRMIKRAVMIQQGIFDI